MMSRIENTVSTLSCLVSSVEAIFSSAFANAVRFFSVLRFYFYFYYTNLQPSSERPTIC